MAGCLAAGQQDGSIADQLLQGGAPGECSSASVAPESRRSLGLIP
jgi:hypothetical protein